MTSTTKPKKPAVKKRVAGVTKVRALASKQVHGNSMYSENLAAQFCAHIAEGYTLREIQKMPGMPTIYTVFQWLADERKPEFKQLYARAREAQAEMMADEIVSISDETDVASVMTPDGAVDLKLDATAVARNRLRVDARKWVAAKLLPKKYGDKLGVDHGGNINLTVNTGVPD